ncbi:uncharacterized protein LOC117890569 [Drosophila subobscura]|uniref:uncharacterized protein LOC117890569 n=1 Tax=Drosophila subobscura TaxID=7241 RepID=UPI00155A3C0A|nr:uncharacterized protein LOC117890569 [Drosophila subobscura]
MSDVEKATKIKGKQRLPEDDGDAADEAGSGPCSAVGVKTTATLMAKKKSCPQRCLGHLLKLVLSTPGLMLLVTLYSVLGALIFPLLEAPQDLNKSAAIAKSREDCLRELWIITEKLNVLYERNWTMLVHEQLRRFEGSIVAATRQGAAGVGGAASFQPASASALGHFGYDLGDPQSWTFSEALLYSVTVITTIGHGSLTPRTAAGKLATIFYALIGVPLMLMCLSSLGALLAEALQCTYMRLCCQLQMHRKRRKPAQGGTASTATTAKPTATTTATKRRQAAGNGANCRSCKYDAANTETSLNECYEYGQGQKAAARGNLPPGKGEDACQLLHSLNQQQQQMAQQQQQHFYPPQQQQQQQQQQPDVMLMTTTTTGSAMLKYAPQQQQQQQHQQQQQQQQLSTATLPRQHHQHPHAHAHGHPQQQLQQNFVAVPSSMLRSMPLAMPPNCYGPATATIYFPFAPSAAGSPQHSHHLAATTDAANGPGSGPGPGLVKYHTIHLQPASSKHRLLASALDQPPIVGQGAESTATLESITLPPPPAYQTASIHAVRRGKFVTKPLPHEINALMDSGTVAGAGTGDCDLSSRHDLLPYALTTAATSTAASASPAASSPALLTYTAAATGATAAAAATSPQLSGGIKAATGGGGAATMSDNSFIAAGVCGMAATAAGTTPPTSSSAAATLSTLLCSNATGSVDIMEDEDEQERERLSNCPHGTPSRVPLIASPLSVPQDSGERTGGCGQSGSRGLLNATAASFHRHTMQPLSRKKMLLTRRCQRHATAALYDGAATATETSDDEEYMQQGSEQFVLRKLRCHSESEDGGQDEETEDECEERQHRVPISLVLLILMCYISAGTVIFALWEDWSLVDGAYFCFVTLSTIGYGDFVPARSFNGPALQLYACCAYLLLGLVLVAMSFSILETQLMWKCRRIAVRLKLARTD